MLVSEAAAGNSLEDKMDNMLSQLQKIAVEKVGTNNTFDTSSKITSEQETNSLNEIFDTAKEMYPQDFKKASEYVLKTVQPNKMSTNGIKNYWTMFDTKFPDYADSIKTQILTSINQNLDSKTNDSEKEFYLRDIITTLPSWAADNFYPKLAQVSMNVANSNMSKATQLYKSELDKRMDSIRYSNLDPEVANSVHVDDILKLETLNMLNSARVVNGRVAVITEDGTVVLANELKDRTEVFGKTNTGSPSIHEQVEIEKLSRDIITKAVNTSLSKTREEVTKQNNSISFETRMNLEKGMFTIDEWDTAFSTINTTNIESAITAGLRGEINAGRVKTNRDLQETLFTVLKKYKDILGGK